ncbi:alpha/beta hydrolase [Polyangium sp. 6x1]|uniref:alpha/beta hydrolase n=1 Tax=Polyangium sp. 6x1 TaxID=3042689 RepID=UPI0024822421|nr:alpha/beta hydrolase [Polyangium sp. 6x1]MDI1447148.1 alpha/beta hydrolase [Polyangium sp. 6x1]
MRLARASALASSSLLALTIGCGGAVAPPESKPPRPALSWSTCPDARELECATFSVPRDHARPTSGEVFTLPVARRTAAKPSERIGSLIVNPGGPGLSAITFLQTSHFLFPWSIRDHFDIVAFDPRGLSTTTPKLDCVDDLEPLVSIDPTPDDAAELAQIQAAADAVVSGCKRRSGGILSLVGTQNVARDMDLLRKALGDESLTYLGLSYGTFLGAVYADLYPQNIRAMVLDSARDPKITAAEWLRGQALGFEAQLEAFLADCKENPRCPFHSDGDPHRAYDALLAKVESSPIPAGSTGRSLGPGQWLWAVAAALYSPDAWPVLGMALLSAANGDATRMLELADGYLERAPDGTYSDAQELFYAVHALDMPFSVDMYEPLVRELRKKAPRLGAYLPYTTAVSARWPAPPTRKPGPIVAKGAPPILVVGVAEDAATPFASSASLAAELSSGVLLAREGKGHIAFLRGNRCIDDAVAAYLVNLTVPANGTRCK